jgi:hypothetical protein
MIAQVREVDLDKVPLWVEKLTSEAATIRPAGASKRPQWQ